MSLLSHSERRNRLVGPAYKWIALSNTTLGVLMASIDTSIVLIALAAIFGSVIGLILGGILAYFDWRLVFLVSVPVGIVGTIWAYLMLRETASIREHQRVDWVGNVTFAVGLTILLLGITYGIEPYGN